tara:strand:- start:59 stop:205 length:147 start_codon:yes stop_codon:yes gene_type:complete
MDKIIGWKLVITWEDDTDEDVTDIPDWCASHVDNFLNELEEEYSNGIS